MCKSARALPYLSANKRSTALWHRFRSSIINIPIPDTAGRQIATAPWPASIDETGLVHFEPSTNTAAPAEEIRPDIVIFASGYTKWFPFLDKGYPSVDTADVRGIYSSDDVSVGFIGFIRPGIGKFCYSSQTDLTRS